MGDLNLTNVKKSFGPVDVIKGVDLEVKDGEFCVFVGPSGCGKSTLLRIIAGLEDATSGDILIDGKRVNTTPPSQREIAMVFQSYALYPHLTVRDNMALGLKQAGAKADAVRERVGVASRMLSLEPLLDRRPAELSGGQRQRVAIGRAIVRTPKLFLFDEPLSNLDAALRVNTRIEIARLHRELKATMIYVTHDQVEAMTLADRIVVLNGGEVEQFGSPLDQYHEPQNLFVAGFIGSPKMNLLPGEVVAGTDNALTVRLADGSTVLAPAADAHAGDKVTVGLRPEHLVEGGGGDAELRGQVVAVEHLGGETYIYLEHGGAEPLVVKAGGDASAKVDEILPIGVPTAACYLFDDSGQAFARPR
jgi:multiple sugar transport system ATP-binding protein